MMDETTSLVSSSTTKTHEKKSLSRKSPIEIRCWRQAAIWVVIVVTGLAAIAGVSICSFWLSKILKRMSTTPSATTTATLTTNQTADDIQQLQEQQQQLLLHEERDFTTKSCSQLLEGVYRVTCMPYDRDEPNMDGIAATLYVGWTEPLPIKTSSAPPLPQPPQTKEPAPKHHPSRHTLHTNRQQQPQPQRRWKYYECSDLDRPSGFYDGQTYLEYADAILPEGDALSRSDSRNCFTNLEYKHKVGIAGNWETLSVPWSWNSMDNGHTVLLSSPGLTCLYQTVQDYDACRAVIEEIKGNFVSFQGQGEVLPFPTAEGALPLTKLCGKPSPPKPPH
ncbi:hypothetical protein ACA910_003783 [Epithemia clementina (nom. ined.)]